MSAKGRERTEEVQALGTALAALNAAVGARKSLQRRLQLRRPAPEQTGRRGGKAK